MEELHIGEKIREKVDERGCCIKWLSDKLGCCRDNIYKIFQRKYIDTGLLLKVSMLLDYDFFAEYSALLNKKNRSGGQDNRVT